ncbi:MAG: hypothetical protein E7643_02760 [Ruminococcaceae bacterium]|nr:hypothetical protein [Oscillospiraceae bacterium]
MKKTNKKILLLRTFLLVLIILNMTLIFLLSAENGEKSTQTAEKVESAVVDTFLPNADKESVEYSLTIDRYLTVFLRKFAHVLEFASLGALILVFILTWHRSPLLSAAISLSLTLLYAISDEFHQFFISDRNASVTDVLIDMAGALGATLIILLCVYLHKRKKFKLKVTRYTLASPSPSPLRIALAADLHDEGHRETLEAIRAAAPDLILIPGDLTDDEGLLEADAPAYDFLRECASIAPTYYSLGNHEIACYHRGNPWRHPTPIPPTQECRERIRETGAVLLDNDCVMHGSICICGLTSGINKKENKPNAAALSSFAEREGYRILLCHHPEYYVPYIKETKIDLTVCGHAHGGQWRIFGRGIYSPGQGLFPKYTAGVLDGRCIISRGIGNHTFIPRIFNAPEVILIETQAE